MEPTASSTLKTVEAEAVPANAPSSTKNVALCRKHAPYIEYCVHRAASCEHKQLALLLSSPNGVVLFAGRTVECFSEAPKVTPSMMSSGATHKNSADVLT